MADDPYAEEDFPDESIVADAAASIVSSRRGDSGDLATSPPPWFTRRTMEEDGELAALEDAQQNEAEAEGENEEDEDGDHLEASDELGESPGLKPATANGAFRFSLACAASSSSLAAFASAQSRLDSLALEAEASMFSSPSAALIAENDARADAFTASFLASLRRPSASGNTARGTPPPMPVLDEMEEHVEEAAIKVQSFVRARSARRQRSKDEDSMRRQQVEAATRIQAVQRGRMVRTRKAPPLAADESADAPVDDKTPSPVAQAVSPPRTPTPPPAEASIPVAEPVSPLLTATPIPTSENAPVEDEPASPLTTSPAAAEEPPALRAPISPPAEAFPVDAPVAAVGNEASPLTDPSHTSQVFEDEVSSPAADDDDSDHRVTSSVTFAEEAPSEPTPISEEVPAVQAPRARLTRKQSTYKQTRAVTPAILTAAQLAAAKIQALTQSPVNHIRASSSATNITLLEEELAELKRQSSSSSSIADSTAKSARSPLSSRLTSRSPTSAFAPFTSTVASAIPPPTPAPATLPPTPQLVEEPISTPADAGLPPVPAGRSRRASTLSALSSATATPSRSRRSSVSSISPSGLRIVPDSTEVRAAAALRIQSVQRGRTVRRARGIPLSPAPASPSPATERVQAATLIQALARGRNVRRRGRATSTPLESCPIVVAHTQEVAARKHARAATMASLQHVRASSVAWVPRPKPLSTSERVAALLAQITAPGPEHEAVTLLVGADMGQLYAYLCTRILQLHASEASDRAAAYSSPLSASAITGQIASALVDLMCFEPRPNEVDEPDIEVGLLDPVLFSAESRHLRLFARRWESFFQVGSASAALFALLASKQPPTVLKAVVLLNHITSLRDYMSDLVDHVWQPYNACVMLDAVTHLCGTPSAVMHKTASLVPLATLVHDVARYWETDTTTAPVYASRLFSPVLARVLLGWSTRGERKSSSTTVAFPGVDDDLEAAWGSLYPHALVPPSGVSSEAALAAWVSTLSLSALRILCTRAHVLLGDADGRELAATSFLGILSHTVEDLAVTTPAQQQQGPPPTARWTSRFVMVLTCMHALEAAADEPQDGSSSAAAVAATLLAPRTGLASFRSSFVAAGGLRLLLQLVSRDQPDSDDQEEQAEDVIHPHLVQTLAARLIASWSHVPHILTRLEAQCPGALVLVSREEAAFDLIASSELPELKNPEPEEDPSPLRDLPRHVAQLRDLVFAHRLYHASAYLSALALDDAAGPPATPLTSSTSAAAAALAEQQVLHTRVLEFCVGVLHLLTTSPARATMQALLLVKLASCSGINIQRAKNAAIVPPTTAVPSLRPPPLTTTVTVVPPPAPISPPPVDPRALLFQVFQNGAAVALLSHLAAEPFASTARPFVALALRALLHSPTLPPGAAEAHWLEFVVLPKMPSVSRSDQNNRRRRNASVAISATASVHHLYLLLVDLISNAAKTSSIVELLPMLQTLQRVVARAVDQGLRLEEEGSSALADAHKPLLLALRELLVAGVPDELSNHPILARDVTQLLVRIIVDLSSLPSLHTAILATEWPQTLLGLIEGQSVKALSTFAAAPQVMMALHALINLFRDTDIAVSCAPRAASATTARGAGSARVGSASASVLKLAFVKKTLYHYLAFLCRRSAIEETSVLRLALTTPSRSIRVASARPTVPTLTLPVIKEPEPEPVAVVVEKTAQLVASPEQLTRMSSSRASPWVRRVGVVVYRADATGRMRKAREAAYPSYVLTHNHVGDLPSVKGDVVLNELIAAARDAASKVVEAPTVAPEDPSIAAKRASAQMVHLQRLVLELLLLVEGAVGLEADTSPSRPTTGLGGQLASPRKMVAQSLLDCHTIALLVSSLPALSSVRGSAAGLPLRASGLVLKIMNNPAFEFVAAGFGGGATARGEAKPVAVATSLSTLGASLVRVSRTLSGMGPPPAVTVGKQAAAPAPVDPALARHGFLLAAALVSTTPADELATMPDELHQDLLAFLFAQLSRATMTNEACGPEDVLLLLQCLDRVFSRTSDRSVALSLSSRCVASHFFALLAVPRSAAAQKPEVLVLLSTLLQRFIDPLVAALRARGVVVASPVNASPVIAAEEDSHPTARFKVADVAERVLPALAWLAAKWSAHVVILRFESGLAVVNDTSLRHRWAVEVRAGLTLQAEAMRAILRVLDALKHSASGRPARDELHDSEHVLAILRHAVCRRKHSSAAAELYEVLLNFVIVASPSRDDGPSPVSDMQAPMLRYFTLLVGSDAEVLRRLATERFFERVLVEQWWSPPATKYLIALLRVVIERSAPNVAATSAVVSPVASKRWLGSPSLAGPATASPFPAYLYAPSTVQTLLLLAHYPASPWRTDAWRVLRLMVTQLVAARKAPPTPPTRGRTPRPRSPHKLDESKEAEESTSVEPAFDLPFSFDLLLELLKCWLVEIPPPAPVASPKSSTARFKHVPLRSPGAPAQKTPTRHARTSSEMVDYALPTEDEGAIFAPTRSLGDLKHFVHLLEQLCTPTAVQEASTRALVMYLLSQRIEHRLVGVWRSSLILRRANAEDPDAAFDDNEDELAKSIFDLLVFFSQHSAAFQESVAEAAAIEAEALAAQEETSKRTTLNPFTTLPASPRTPSHGLAVLAPVVHVLNPTFMAPKLVAGPPPPLPFIPSLLLSLGPSYSSVFVGGPSLELLTSLATQVCRGLRTPLVRAAMWRYEWSTLLSALFVHAESMWRPISSFRDVDEDEFQFVLASHIHSSRYLAHNFLRSVLTAHFFVLTDRPLYAALKRRLTTALQAADDATEAERKARYITMLASPELEAPMPELPPLADDVDPKEDAPENALEQYARAANLLHALVRVEPQLEQQFAPLVDVVESTHGANDQSGETLEDADTSSTPELTSRSFASSVPEPTSPSTLTEPNVRALAAMLREDSDALRRLHAVNLFRHRRQAEDELRIHARKKNVLPALLHLGLTMPPLTLSSSTKSHLCALPPPPFSPTKQPTH